VPPEPAALIVAAPIPLHPLPCGKWQPGRRQEGRKPESETGKIEISEQYIFGASMGPKIPRKRMARKCLHTSSMGRVLTKL
jgi:hypothetical protein